MRICRFNENRIGVVNDDHISDVSAIVMELPPHRYPLPNVDPFIAGLVKLMPRMRTLAFENAPTCPIDSATLMSPVANPGKVMAAPVNYRKHLDEARTDPGIHFQKEILEIQRVGLFLKASSSVVGAGQGIAIRHPERRNDHEIELAVVIGSIADRVSVQKALSCIAGYCIGLDMTTRGPEERSLRKSIDSYTVLGPWLVTADEVPNSSDLDLELSVNGKVRQIANTRDLIIDIPELIAFASSFYTLFPGDVLLSGTPDGVGPVYPGDVIRASIERVGTMEVRVRATPPLDT